MRVMQRLTAFILALVIFSASIPTVNAIEVSDVQNNIRAIFIDISDPNNIDSSDENYNSKMMAYIDKTISFMEENNMNTIYFRTPSQTEFIGEFISYSSAEGISGGSVSDVDLLSYAISSGQAKGINVVSWVVPWSLSDDYNGENSINQGDKKYLNIATAEGRQQGVDVVKKLIDNYKTDIVIDTNFYPDVDFNDGEYYKPVSKKQTLDQFRTENISKYIEEISKIKGNSNLGVIVKSDSYNVGLGGDVTEASYSAVPAWVNNNWIDYAIPVMDMKINAVGDGKDFMYFADKWSNLVDATNAKWMPVLSTSKMVSKEYIDPSEISIQMFYAMNKNTVGVAFDDASGFISDNEQNKNWVNRIIDFFYNGDPIKDKFEPGFKLTRPEKNIEWEQQYYYLMGISDPSKTLFVNGEDVDYRGKQGTFGHYVLLEPGDNYYEFTQPGLETQFVTITYNPPKEKAQQYIDKITQKTMDPVIQDIAYVGERYTLECVAPATGEVTAQIGKDVIELEQVETAAVGVAAVFRGYYTVPDNLSSNKVEMYGKVAYTLNFNGKTTQYESNGNLFFAHSQDKIRVKSREYMTTVYETQKINYSYNSIMNVGTEDVITGQTSSMFELSQGGFVKKQDVDILYEVNESNDKVSNVKYATSYDSEKLTFEGAENTAFRIDIKEGGNISVSLYNIVGVAQTNKAFGLIKKHSKLFSDAIVTQNENSINIEFITKNDEDVWGYSFDHDGKNSVLYFAKKPKLSSDTAKPLKDVTILLDPGHGGSDPGASGPAMEYGPVEKDATMLIANETKKSLEQLGATVLLTRTQDNSMELYHRASITDKIKPDMFISIHLNSVAEVSDGGKADGVEVYYVTPQSYDLGENIMNSISSYTGRKTRDVIHGVYVVARPTSAPSVLCETGFMPNPTQYEDMINTTTIERTGVAISKAVKSTLE